MSKENYREDGEPRALYYSEYRETLERYKGKVHFGEVIPLDSSVSFVGTNDLIPTSFDLRNVDRQPFNGFTLPGKSAHISFTKDLRIICGAIFDRKPRSVDHLYTVNADELVRLDFYPYYLPLPNLPLHLRVVHGAQQEDPTIRDIPYKARVELASLLNRNKIC